MIFRDGGVAFNHHRHDAAFGFDTERQRSDVEQQDVFHFARQHAALNGSANRHHFVGIDVLLRLFAENFFGDRLSTRHAR